MYFDGSLMKTGAGTGLIFVSPLGVRMCYVIRLHFAASNNIAEYEGLVNGLYITVELGIKGLDVRGDSQLIVDQVMKESSYHDPKMEAYYKAVRHLEDRFDGLELNHIACKHNEAADELAKIESGRTTVPLEVFTSDLHKPSVDYKKSGQEGKQPPEPTLLLDPPEGSDPPSMPELKVMEIDEQLNHDDEPNWRIPYLARLIQGVLPLDQTQAQRLAQRAKSFMLLDRELYKCSASGILQRCIPLKDERQLLREIHSGLAATT
jgi:ribonuclease HI